MLSNVYDHFFNAFYPYFWKYRHLWSKGWPESYISEESLKHPHRRLLLDAVSKFEPFDSLLEYGCGPGANLFLLAKKYPKAKFYGVDVSKDALEKAIKLPNIEYLTKKVDWLQTDLFLTDACLIYKRAPWGIVDAIRSYGKGYIGCEWHDEKGTFGHGRHWVHNYRKLFPGCELRKLTWEDWQDDGWSTYGHIITWRR